MACAARPPYKQYGPTVYPGAHRLSRAPGKGSVPKQGHCHRHRRRHHRRPEGHPGSRRRRLQLRQIESGRRRFRTRDQRSRRPHRKRKSLGLRQAHLETGTHHLLLICRGAVAQLEERPSKDPRSRCNSFDVSSYPGRGIRWQEKILSAPSGEQQTEIRARIVKKILRLILTVKTQNPAIN